ncbi:MAG TPA: hypothetical protein VG963_07835 [Polyangiaceae bacterium]|nr:hypothetical protein [Polyangiaceae bacterium]
MKSLLLSGLYLSAVAAVVACSSADSETGSLQQALETQHCGGNIANAPTCPDGFECVPDPNSSLPFGDVGGICQAQHCGGNIANAPTCPDGFECVPDPNSSLPFGDVGGICQAASDDGGAPDQGHHHRRHHRHGRH